MRRLSCVLALVVMLVLLLLAGCGSSSKKTATTSSSTSAASSTPTQSASTAPAASATAATTTPGAAGITSAQQAVATCKHIVSSLSTLPASTRHGLEGVCDKAGKGSIAEIRKAAEKLCLEAAANPVLPASAKERILAACSGK